MTLPTNKLDSLKLNDNERDIIGDAVDLFGFYGMYYDKLNRLFYLMFGSKEHCDKHRLDATYYISSRIKGMKCISVRQSDSIGLRIINGNEKEIVLIMAYSGWDDEVIE